MKSYISIHDVTPNNLDDIENIIRDLKNKFHIQKICLLVIPGLNWNKKQIQRLKSWQNDNIVIAAHGWTHRAASNKTFYHRIHSLVMSSNCAEHLSKDRKTVLSIIKNSYEWFKTNKLGNIKLYVPPAWALGTIKTSDF